MYSSIFNGVLLHLNVHWFDSYNNIYNDTIIISPVTQNLLMTSSLHLAFDHWNRGSEMYFKLQKQLSRIQRYTPPPVRHDTPSSMCKSCRIPFPVKLIKYWNLILKVQNRREFILENVFIQTLLNAYQIKCTVNTMQLNSQNNINLRSKVKISVGKMNVFHQIILT